MDKDMNKIIDKRILELLNNTETENRYDYEFEVEKDNISYLKFLLDRNYMTKEEIAENLHKDLMKDRILTATVFARPCISYEDANKRLMGNIDIFEDVYSYYPKETIQCAADDSIKIDFLIRAYLCNIMTQEIMELGRIAEEMINDNDCYHISNGEIKYTVGLDKDGNIGGNDFTLDVYTLLPDELCDMIIPETRYENIEFAEGFPEALKEWEGIHSENFLLAVKEMQKEIDHCKHRWK